MNFDFRPSYLPRNDQGCDETAALLTALFDGEADADQAARAREHLLLCQRCARLWTQWHTTRRLLQITPVAAPPPALLARILLACRLSRPSKTPSNDLQTRILAQTTGFTPQTSKPHFSRFAPLSALAVPALGAWLLILQPPTPQSIHNTSPEPTALNSAPRTAKFPVMAPTRALKTVAQAPALAPVITPIVPAPLETLATHPHHAAEISISTPPTAREVIFEPSAPLRNIVQPLATAPREVTEPRATLATATITSITATQSMRPAILAAPVESVRLRPVARPLSRLIAIPRMGSAAHPGLRVSLPSSAWAARPVATELPSNEEENADQPLDEVRTLVDDYRATLVSDNMDDDSGFNG